MALQSCPADLRLSRQGEGGSLGLMRPRCGPCGGAAPTWQCPGLRKGSWLSCACRCLRVELFYLGSVLQAEPTSLGRSGSFFGLSGPQLRSVPGATGQHMENVPRPSHSGPRSSSKAGLRPCPGPALTSLEWAALPRGTSRPSVLTARPVPHLCSLCFLGGWTHLGLSDHQRDRSPSLQPPGSGFGAGPRVQSVIAFVVLICRQY